jgi:hypothetical protein
MRQTVRLGETCPGGPSLGDMVSRMRNPHPVRARTTDLSITERKLNRLDEILCSEQWQPSGNLVG